MKQLEGKVALVAGAGRNNGKAISLAFAREGADLVLVARERKQELEAVADEWQEVVNVAVFLASDQYSFVTGDRIVCAGGRYM